MFFCVVPVNECSGAGGLDVYHKRISQSLLLLNYCFAARLGYSDPLALFPDENVV